MSNSTENRKNNFIVIYDFFQKNFLINIRHLLKNYIQKVLLMENGLKIQLVSLQHVYQRGKETIVVFLFSLLAKLNKDVKNKFKVKARSNIIVFL